LLFHESGTPRDLPSFPTRRSSDLRDLRSHIGAEILEKGKLLLHEHVKAEMHQSVIEVGTGICRNIKEARDDITNLRRSLIHLARDRKSTRLNSSHSQISYAVFCLK